MRPKRLLAAWLCASLAVHPQAYAQASNGAVLSLGSGPAVTPDAMSTAAAPATPPKSVAAASGHPPDASNAPIAAAPALVNGPLDDSADPVVPASIAQGVFGTYGGAQSRFSAQSQSGPLYPGGNGRVRAPTWVPQLPDLGDGSGGALTPQAERRIGERVMREIRRDPDYIGDWLVLDYLDSVATRLAAAASEQFIGGYRPDFELFAVRDGQINAFSLPGGFIGVNTGLIVATQTESELASVLGHEMGHVLQRHIARMLSQNERTSLTALAGVLFGILAGVLAHSGDLGSAIALGSQAYAVDTQLRFSRTAEHEADRVGFKLLSGAGYDPWGMVAFFERLERDSMGDTGVPAYARTHPLTGERIADMQDRARRADYRQPRQAPEYGFVRARVRVLQDRTRGDYIDEVSRLRSELEDRTALNVAANWYGIAFAQMLLERYEDATASLTNSRAAFAQLEAADGSKTRNSPSLDVLAIEIARRSGRTDDAVRLGEAAHKAWPASHAAADSLLQALLSARRFKDAQALARSETEAEPQQGAWWLYLAQASAGLGDTLTRHRATAEKLALDGAWPSAIRQLKEARDMKSVGYYDLSTIDARLHDFEARYKQEREDEKDEGRS
ncbi:MAG: M48 family metalloprotease [Paraburkholderia sp.]|nr:M48 family metalloprotease [Paraburkholderia sp.]